MAHHGWKSILEMAVIKESNCLDVAVNYEEAVEKIKSVWDIIFLDMRFSESDFSVDNFNNYSGFRLLKEIRKNFDSINFCTPIILITASNKIWNIDAFQENGIDGFYIKEHPDYRFDKQTSRNNLENLQNVFKTLIIKGQNKREVWTLCNSIIQKVHASSYFKTQEKTYVNIKNRIIDKIKLGYYQLFQNQTILEKDILLSYNESLSFIIFWSILEEISKGFTKISETWDSKFERNSNWKFKNGDYFILFENNEIRINYGKNDNGDYIKKSFVFSVESSEYKKYSKSSIINLSDQIYSLLSAYSKNNDEFRQISNQFKALNRYRNETDFIHGSVINILTKDLLSHHAVKLAFLKNIELLKFLDTILNFNTK
jgi:CheY-like chemotaxis protein